MQSLMLSWDPGDWRMRKLELAIVLLQNMHLPSHVGSSASLAVHGRPQAGVTARGMPGFAPLPWCGQGPHVADLASKQGKAASSKQK